MDRPPYTRPYERAVVEHLVTTYCHEPECALRLSLQMQPMRASKRPSSTEGEELASRSAPEVAGEKESTLADEERWLVGAAWATGFAAVCGALCGILWRPAYRRWLRAPRRRLRALNDVRHLGHLDFSRRLVSGDAVEIEPRSSLDFSRRLDNYYTGVPASDRDTLSEARSDTSCSWS